jgi:hypothetical protein
VAELDELIDQFVHETGALYPKPNPNYMVDASDTPASLDLTAGLVPRNSVLVKTDGAIRVIGKGRQPFLGTAQVKFSGPLTLKLRVRSTAGGEGRIQWRIGSQNTFLSEHVVTFKVPAGTTWQDVSIPLPIQGKVSVIRLYFPAEKTAVDVQVIRFMDKRGREKLWDFKGVSP